MKKEWILTTMFLERLWILYSDRPHIICGARGGREQGVAGGAGVIVGCEFSRWCVCGEMGGGYRLDYKQQERVRGGEKIQKQH